MRAIKKIPTSAKKVPVRAAKRETDATTAYTVEISLFRIVVACRASVSPKPMPKNHEAQSTPADECFLKVALELFMSQPSRTYLRTTCVEAEPALIGER